MVCECGDSLKLNWIIRFLNVFLPNLWPRMRKHAHYFNTFSRTGHQ